MKTLKYLLVMLFLMSGTVYSWAQNSIINRLSVIDSSSNSILMGRQSIVEDQGTFYLFYTLMNTSVDYLIMRSTTDNGATWTTPDTISVHAHSTTARYHLNQPTVTLDDQHYFHIMCKYTGEPLYASSWASYPPQSRQLRYQYQRQVDHPCECHQRLIGANRPGQWDNRKLPE